MRAPPQDIKMAAYNTLCAAMLVLQLASGVVMAALMRW
jgi:hypothetical protein